MKKLLIYCFIVFMLFTASACSDNTQEAVSTHEAYIIETIKESNEDDIQELVGNELYIMTTHYKLSDGTWKTDHYSYKYKLIITGRMHNAAKDSTFHILSNRADITFDMAWKAFGFSSNSEDYFKPEDAVFVAFE